MRRKGWVIFLLGLICVLSVSPTCAGQAAEDVIYRFDPVLTVEQPRPPELSADPNVVIVNNDKEKSLRLQTDTQLSPYLGAERGPELSPEELRLIPEAKDLGQKPDYRLEAGVGLFVEDKASLNLGYRVHTHPSLLEDRRNDPLSLSGDVRISFDVKVPF